MGTTSEHQSDSEPDHASLSSRNLHHLCHCTNPLPSGTCSEHALLTSHFVSPFTPLTSGFTSLNPLHLHYWYCTLLAYYRHKFLHSLVFFFFHSNSVWHAPYPCHTLLTMWSSSKPSILDFASPLPAAPGLS